MRVMDAENPAPAKAPDSEAMTESQALSLARRGDPAGFEHLYRKHSRRVYALCLRMTGNSSEAEDLTQDAFVQVFRKIQTFRGESAFSTWLHRLAVNIVLMRNAGRPSTSFPWRRARKKIPTSGRRKSACAT